eukprot:8056752-Ditylum_brightwellii.AAC.1
MSASTLIARRNEGHVPTMHLNPIYQEDYGEAKRIRLRCALCTVEEACMQTLVMKPRRMFSMGIKEMSYCQ